MNPDTRRSQIEDNLKGVEGRIVAACDAARRSRDEITLVAVTKSFPSTDIRHLVDLGIRDVGENRDQEAAPKVAECERAGLSDVRWHFVGQLQTNKARSVSGYAYLVHSVDRARLVRALATAAAARARPLRCLIQVDLAPAPGDARAPGSPAPPRGGVPPAAVGALAADIDAAENLLLDGVMAVAPLGGDASSAFARLAVVARELRASYPEAVVVSAGMSGDLEAAVSHGATHLRVGTALLGSRPLLR